MSGSMNKVILIGNLGQDPEISRTQSGGMVANFSIATSDSWRDKTTGDRKERTEWHRIVTFNEKICEVIERYLKKGSKVAIEGELRTRKWQGSDGIDRYTTEVVIPIFGGGLTMLGDPTGGGRPPKPDSQNDYGRESGRDSGREAIERQTQEEMSRRQGGGFNRDLDDDIPF